MDAPDDDYDRLLILSIIRDDEQVTNVRWIGSGGFSKVYVVKLGFTGLLICQVCYKQPGSQV